MKKTNPFLKFLTKFWWLHPVDDRRGGDPVVITTVEDRYLLLVVWFNKTCEQLLSQRAERQSVVNLENIVFVINRFKCWRFTEVVEGEYCHI